GASLNSPNAVGFAGRRATILPVPEGASRGEGEMKVEMEQRFCMGLELVPFLEELAQASDGARQQRFRLEVEADFAGAAVQQYDVLHRFDFRLDFEEGLDGLASLRVVLSDRHFATGMPA